MKYVSNPMNKHISVDNNVYACVIDVFFDIRTVFVFLKTRAISRLYNYEKKN